jgi:hypothetical protein
MSWLGRQFWNQTFEDDASVDVTEIRAILTTESDNVEYKSIQGISMPEMPDPGASERIHVGEQAFGGGDAEIRDRPVHSIETERRYLLDEPDDMKRLESVLQAKYPGVQMVGAYYEYSFIYPDMDRNRLTQLSGYFRDPDVVRQIEQIPAGQNVSLTVKEWENREFGGLYANIKASGDPLSDETRLEIETELVETRAEKFARESGLGQPDTIWAAEPRRRWQLEDGTIVDVMINSGYGCSAEIEASSAERITQLEAELGGDQPLVPLSGEVKKQAYVEYKEADFSWEGDRPWGQRTFTQEQWARISQRSGEEPVRNRIVT